MKAGYSDASYLSLYPVAGATTVDDAKELFNVENKPILTDSTAACEFVVGQIDRSQQKILHGHTTARTPNSHRLRPKSTAHSEGHSDLFPAPPKAWECCGCGQKFYNFEKQCDFCATLFCKDCKKIPWK